MTIEEAHTFLDNLMVCIEEHPIVADWLVEIADRKTEPTTEDCSTVPTSSKMEQVEDEPQTCSFSDCDNFKNPDYARCIECKRKQIESKDKPQTEPLQTCSVNGRPYTDCCNCEHFKCTADEPQTERRCGNCKFLTYRWNKTWCDIKCENPHDVVCDKWAERSE